MSERLTREDVTDALAEPAGLPETIVAAARWAAARLPHRRCPRCDGSGKWFHPSNGNIGYWCPQCGGAKVVAATLSEDLVDKIAEVLARYGIEDDVCVVAARATLAALANGASEVADGQT